MEVTFPSDLEDQLARLASRQGRDTTSLVVDAVRQMIDFDVWFVSEVDKGLSQIEAGDTLSHEQVGERLERFLATKQSRVWCSFVGHKRPQGTWNGSPIFFLSKRLFTRRGLPAQFMKRLLFWRSSRCVDGRAERKKRGS